MIGVVRRVLLTGAITVMPLLIPMAAPVLAESAAPGTSVSETSAPVSPGTGASGQATTPGPDGWEVFIQAMGSSPITLVAGLAVLVCVWVIGYGNINRKQKTQLVGSVMVLVAIVVLASFFSERQRDQLAAAKEQADIAAALVKAKAEIEGRYNSQLQDCRSTLNQLRVVIDEKLKNIEDADTVRALANVMLRDIDGATTCFEPTPTLAPPSGGPASQAPGTGPPAS